MKIPIIIAVVVALLVGAGAFFGGMKFQQSKITAADGGAGHNQTQGGQQGRGRFGGGNNGAPVRGEITSSDNTSITVKMQDGSSKIILLSDTTAITEATSSSKESLTTGKQVMVFGSSNSDGSVTAQNIQLNPREGFGGDNGAGHQGETPGGSPE